MSQLIKQGVNERALSNRIAFGVFYTISIIGNPQNPIPIIKAPTLHRPFGSGRYGLGFRV